MATLEIMNGVLTDEHSASSYGQPVFVRGDEVYGPCDVLPEQITFFKKIQSRIPIKMQPLFLTLTDAWNQDHLPADYETPELLGPNDYPYHNQRGYEVWPELLRLFFDLGVDASRS